MSPTGQRLWSTIAAAKRRVHIDGLWAAAGSVAAVVPAVLVLAWAVGGAETWRDPGAAPLAVELLAVLGGGALAWWLFRRWIAAYDEAHAAAAAEETLGLPSGTVRGVLELSRTVPEGTSPALYLRAEGEVARQLSATTPAQLTGAAGIRARRRRNQALLALGAAVAFVLVLGFASPERASAGWRPLVHPVAHLTPPPMPALEVRPGNARVPRGGSLTVRVLAKGRHAVAVHWRSAGDVPRNRELGVSGDSAATSLASIDAPLTYWVTSPDGAVSDTFRVLPVDPLLVSDLVVDVTYPSYLGRAPERFDGDVPGLEIPAGTQLRIRGRATRALASAGLVRRDGGVRVALRSTADRFDGTWTPTASGTYDWALVDRSGAAPTAVPGALDLMVVPDSAPQVEVLVPAADTALSSDMKQPIAANVWDDHGLRAASLVSWRVSSLGQRDPTAEQAIPLGGASDHASVEALLDATSRRLLPGDTLHFQIRVTDNSPGGQVGVSRTYTLWIPGMEELRQQADDQAEQLVNDAAELAKTAKGLQESTRDLSRRSASSNARSGSSRGGSPGGNSRAGADGSKSPGYERTEQARQLLDRQEAMVNKVEDLKQRTAQLERTMQAAGLQDPELQNRLKELRQLYDQILTPELRQKLQELKQALADMDQAKMQEALQQLAQQQDEFRKRIDQSLELLRRAAAEQQMNALAQQAREMATQQKALSEAMKKEAQQAQTPEAQKQRQEEAQRQAQLVQKADSLSKAIAQMSKQLDQQGEQQAAQQTAGAQQKADSAQKAMQQAQQQAQQQARQQASQNGEQAADQLQQAAQQLEQTRKGMSESWKEEVQQAVQQATQEALSMAQRQAALAEKMRQAQQGGDQQQGEQQQGQQQGQQQQGQQQQGQQQQGQQLPGQPQLQPPQVGQQKGQQQGQPQGQRPGMQPNGQQSGQQQGGQQQSGGQRPGQQAGGQQQGGQQQGGQKGGQKGQQQGGQQGGQQAGQKGGQQSAQGGGSKAGGQKGEGQEGKPQEGAQSGSQPGGGNGNDMQSMQGEQRALQQSLERLGKNLSEAGEKSALMNRDVGSALGRAMLDMQQTLQGLEQAQDGQMPVQQAEQTVDALNKLALSLATNGQQISESESGTGVQQALEQLAELAKRQGGLNGQSSSLLPMDLAPSAMANEMQGLASQQRDIAQKLGGMANMGGQEDLLGRLDELAKEADAIARDLSGGRLTPDVVARQDKLFHRLLDAGRTMERDEVSNERVAERPGNVGASFGKALDPAMVQGGFRYAVPTEEQLRALPPAYRRMILQYFDRLNRAAAQGAPGAGKATPAAPPPAAPEKTSP